MASYNLQIHGDTVENNPVHLCTLDFDTDKKHLL